MGISDPQYHGHTSCQDLLYLKVLYSIRSGRTWQCGCPTKGQLLMCGWVDGGTNRVYCLQDLLYRLDYRQHICRGHTNTALGGYRLKASSSGLAKAETVHPDVPEPRPFPSATYSGYPLFTAVLAPSPATGMVPRSPFLSPLRCTTTSA